MKRSMAELRMKGEAAPYYIAYEVLDRTMSDVSGRLGAIVENPPRRTRTLRVEVRVGDYTFDSSRFVVQGFGGGAGLSGETVIAPLDDDYDAMRREIWLTTDAAYKRAITMFARKKAAFQNRTASDPIPGFFAGAAGRDDSAARRSRCRSRRAAIAARACSSRRRCSRAHPDVDLSEVAISQVHGTRYYLNSEGFKTVAPIQITSLTMYGEAQAGDGMPVRQTFTDVGRTLADLPSAADLVARAQADRGGRRRRARGADRRGVRRPRADRRRRRRAVRRRDARADDAGAASAGRRESAHGAGAVVAVPESHRPSGDGRRVQRERYAVADAVRGQAARRQLRRRRRRHAREGRDARRKGTAGDAADQPRAAEEFPAVQRPRPVEHRARRRVPDRERAGDSRVRAEGQVHRAAQGAGQDLRLHRAGRAIGRPGRRAQARASTRL